MKKYFSFLLILLLCFIACSDNDEGENGNEPVTNNFTIVQPVQISLPETPTGFVNTYSESDNSPLNQFIQNASSIQDLSVNSISYKFKNINGNNNIQLFSYSLSFNAIPIASNPNQIDLLAAINQGTVFEILDENLYSTIAESIRINNNVSVRSFGDFLSDESSGSFDIEVTVKGTVTTGF
jgi:hypothetical protein